MSLAVAVLILLAGAWAYPQLPQQVASHWNSAGEVDGQMGRFWGAFLLPAIALALWPLLNFLPVADPRRHNIAKFRLEYDRMVLVLMLFLAYVFGLTLAWNLGYEYSMSQAIVPALGLLFVQAGRMTMKAEPNFTAGIRTPWTLSSDTVWRKTHDLGGKLFIGAGLVTLLGLLAPDYTYWFVIGATFVVVGTVIPYSYILFRQERRAAKSEDPAKTGRQL